MSGPLVFNTAQFLVAAYAILRGGGPERRAAMMQVFAALATWLSYNAIVVRFQHLEGGVLSVDVLLALGLYWLALRSNRIWPLAMTALQLASILVHFARVVDPGMAAWSYALLIHIWSYPMVALLALGVFRHRLRLRRHGIDVAWS